MGIESDQLVYDYLSRVGDLAQATTLTAAERARLVTGLRQEIDGRRGGSSGGSQRSERAAVEKILSGIGEPAEVVRQAVHSGVPEKPPTARGGATARTPGRTGAPSVPVQASAPPGGRQSGSGQSGYDGGYQGGYAAGTGPDDWWRTAADGPDDGPGGMPPLIGAAVGELAGWRAVYEADFLDPEGEERAARIPGQRQSATEEPSDEDAAADDADEAPAPPRRRWLPRRAAPPQPDPGPELPRAPRAPLPLVETLAALVLVAAAVLGLWYVAVLGWFFAYSSRRLGQRVARTAGLWLPLGLALASALLLWSRLHGHPGQQETNAAFQSALHSAAAVWLRVAPTASAGYLAWRISRRG